VVRALSVDGASLLVGKDIDLCIRRKLFVGLLLILVTLDVGKRDWYGERVAEESNALDDIILRKKVLERWGGVVDGACEVK
jgi:hypothetical protein